MAKMRTNELLRGGGGSIFFLAVELGAAKLSDSYGWPLVFLVAVFGVVPLAIGWWPEIRTVLIGRLASKSPIIPGQLEYLETDDSGELRVNMPDEVRRKLIYGGIVLGAFVALIIGGGFFAETLGKHLPGHRQALGTKQHPNPLDQTVRFECAWAQIPEAIPAGGYYELEIVGDPNTKPPLAMVFSSLAPGAPNPSAKKDPMTPGYANRCRVTNYGTGPVLNIAARLSFDYKEAIQQKGGTRSGKVVTTKFYDIGPVNLNMGATYEFYLRNYSPYWIDIFPPQAALMQPPGTSSNALAVATLIPPYMESFLPPFFRPPSIPTTPPNKPTAPPMLHKHKERTVAPAPATQSSPPIASANVRDPDTVYQLGDAVGTVDGVQEDRGNSKVFFANIYTHGDLDLTREFEYRDYVLRMTSKMGETDATMAGQKNVRYGQVTCEILRKRD
ncbi:MAG TPA: hypothetical protein VHT03_01775 [Rhizomicrobium sp.]|jgi:hypothetical protein|nr:hypothetical protein [Rhizomicrobium sp.]